jgi:hypothetical protein
MELANILQGGSGQLHSFSMLMMMVNAIIHLFFAGAIAKDVGKLYQLGIKPQLVSGSVWAFATLIGGVMTAFIYWLMHYSLLARTTKERPYEVSDVT